MSKKMALRPSGLSINRVYANISEGVRISKKGRNISKEQYNSLLHITLGLFLDWHYVNRKSKKVDQNLVNILLPFIRNEYFDLQSRMKSLELENEPQIPFEPIKTRDREFAEKMQAAGHPAILVEEQNEDLVSSLYVQVYMPSIKILLEEEDKTNPLPSFEPIKTRDREFAEKMQAAGHPAILVED